jgi:hypothetical protein
VLAVVAGYAFRQALRGVSLISTGDDGWRKDARGLLAFFTTATCGPLLLSVGKGGILSLHPKKNNKKQQQNILIKGLSRWLPLQ